MRRSQRTRRHYHLASCRQGHILAILTVNNAGGTSPIHHKMTCLRAGDNAQILAAKCRLQKGCRTAAKPVDVNRTGFPPVLSPSNIIVMGETLQTRTCALLGTVNFTSVNSSLVAQLNPNARDPKMGVSLCFPLTAMIFFAGIVNNAVLPSPTITYVHNSI